MLATANCSTWRSASSSSWRCSPRSRPPPGTRPPHLRCATSPPCAAALTVSTGWVLVVHNARPRYPGSPGRPGGAFAVGIGCLLWLHSAQAAAALTVIALLNAALLAAWNQ
jgi:hypothetical protein